MISFYIWKYFPGLKMGITFKWVLSAFISHYLFVLLFGYLIYLEATIASYGLDMSSEWPLQDYRKTSITVILSMANDIAKPKNQTERPAEVFPLQKRINSNTWETESPTVHCAGEQFISVFHFRRERLKGKKKK